MAPILEEIPLNKASLTPHNNAEEESMIGDSYKTSDFGYLSGQTGDRAYQMARDNFRRARRRLATTLDHDEEAWRRRSTHRNWQIIDAVGEIVEIRGKSYSQVALNWLLSRPEVSSVIIGVRTPAQLVDNLGAVGWRLSDDELARLNQVSAIDQGYPYRMMELYGMR